jgi:hypothetical protein
MIENTDHRDIDTWLGEFHVSNKNGSAWKKNFCTFMSKGISDYLDVEEVLKHHM